MFIVTKFGADWLIFVDAREETKSNIAIFPNSRANNSSCSGAIGPMIEFIQNLLDINIFTKFGAVKYNSFFFNKGQITLTTLSPLD